MPPPNDTGPEYSTRKVARGRAQSETSTDRHSIRHGKIRFAMKEIKNITIVGSGTMGHSLGLLFSRAGLHVSLVDKSSRSIEEALRLIKSAGETLVEAGQMTREELAKIPSRIHGTTRIEKACKDCHVAIETVDEDPAVKEGIFALLDRHCPDETIFSSNTSALNIFLLAPKRRQKKLLITHFFAPPHIVPLVEVVPGEFTSPGVVETMDQLLRNVGKEPLILKEYIPGFVVNRIQRAISREAFSLVDQGHLSIEDMDRAVKSSLGVRLPVVGVLQTYDFTGLDVYEKICRETPIGPAASAGPPKVVSQKVARGELGVKSGKGLYDYTGKNRKEVLRQRDLHYLRILSALKTAEASRTVSSSTENKRPLKPVSTKE